MNMAQPIKSADNRRLDGTFGPGNIANPNGRPRKELTISDAIRSALEKDPERTQKLVDKLISMAVEGDISAIREIADRIEGKPIQRAVVTDDEAKFDKPYLPYRPQDVETAPQAGNGPDEDRV